MIYLSALLIYHYTKESVPVQGLSSFMKTFTLVLGRNFLTAYSDTLSSRLLPMARF